MPIWLRIFTFKKIQEHYDQQNPQKKDKKSWLKKDKTQSEYQKITAPDFFKNIKGKGKYK